MHIEEVVSVAMYSSWNFFIGDLHHSADICQGVLDGIDDVHYLYLSCLYNSYFNYLATKTVINGKYFLEVNQHRILVEFSEQVPQFFLVSGDDG
jgi:hypothetical protein